MQKKLKWLLAACIVVLLILTLPYFSGILAKSKFKQVVNEIASFTGADAKLIEYKRHWFSADAVVVVNLRPSSFLDKTNKILVKKADDLSSSTSLYRLVIVSHVLHGPMIFSDNKIRFAQGLIESKAVLISQLGQDKQPIKVATANMCINLKGDSNIDLESPPFVYQNANGLLQWKGLEAKFSLSRGLDKRKGMLYLHGIDIAFKNLVFQVDGLQESYQETKSLDGLWIGGNQIYLKALLLKDKDNDKNQLEVSGANIKTSFQESQGLIAGNTTINLDEFVLNGASYKNIIFNWSIDNFSGKVLAKLNQLFKQTQEINKLSVQQIGNGLNLLSQLLDNGAQFNIERLDVSTPWGRLYASAKLKGKPGTNNSKGLLTVLTNLDFTLNLSLEKTLAQQLLENFYQQKNATQKAVDLKAYADSQLRELEQTGKIISKDNYYVIILNYKDQKLLINNKSFSLFGSSND